MTSVYLAAELAPELFLYIGCLYECRHGQFCKERVVERILLEAWDSPTLTRTDAELLVDAMWPDDHDDDNADASGRSQQQQAGDSGGAASGGYYGKAGQYDAWVGNDSFWQVRSVRTVCKMVWRGVWPAGGQGAVSDANRLLVSVTRIVR